MNARLRQGDTFASVLAVLAFAVTALPVAAGIIPADRLTVWAPGIPGGIPGRATICATVPASTYGNGSVDASSGIQAAVDACPAGQVVLLSAGHFTVNNLVLINKGITLRGMGGGSTILTKTNGARARTSPMQPVDPGTYSYDAQPVIVVGPSRWPKIDSTSQNLVADGAKGSNSITVSNASGFAPGSSCFWTSSRAHRGSRPRRISPITEIPAPQRLSRCGAATRSRGTCTCRCRHIRTTTAPRMPPVPTTRLPACFQTQCPGSRAPIGRSTRSRRSLRSPGTRLPLRHLCISTIARVTPHRSPGTAEATPWSRMPASRT